MSFFVYFFKQRTAYEVRISDWSSDVCSSDLSHLAAGDLRFFDGARRFSAVSGSLGASYDLGGHWRIGLHGSRTERAPTAEELFANGGHAGTAAYELGNPNFKPEKTCGLVATLHHYTHEFSFADSRFYICVST